MSYSKRQSLTLTDKDFRVFVRVATSLLLAVLLTVQSIVPCCAIGSLLASGEHSDEVLNQIDRPCCCCPLLLPEQETVPSDNGLPRDDKCPFCGGLMFKSPVDITLAQLTDDHWVFAAPDRGPQLKCGQTPVLYRVVQRQVFGQPFLNTGMRLLI